MKVAAFFRDSRVQAALSGPRSDQAASLVDEFLSLFSYSGCTVTQLLALADLAARCGNVHVTHEALQHAIASGSKLHLAHYKMGRLLLSQSKPEEAAAHFARGAEVDETFPHNWMGAARALHAQDLKSDAALHAERFAAFGARPHGQEDFATLGDLADYLFDAGLRDRALPLYALIVSFGAERPRHVVRLAEARIAAGDYAEASRMLLAQKTPGGLDPWSKRALALCHSHNGEHREAIRLALEAVEANPQNQGFVGTFVRVLGKSGDETAIRDALQQHAGWLTAPDVAELTVRLHLIGAEWAQAAACLAASQIVPESRLYYLSMETAYAALSMGQHDVAMGLAERLRDVAPEAVPPRILQIDVYFRLLMWEEAGTILATMPQQADERPQLAMKRLEYACFTGDRDAAAAAAARLEVMAQTGRQFMLPVFRYRAEQQDWQGVVDGALPWLDGSLDYGQIGYVLFRAAKRTGRQQDMLAAIHAIPAWPTRPGLLTLRNNLAYDAARSIEAIDALTRDPALAGNSTMRRKLAVRRDVLARATGVAARNAVFLCTDRNYLCATVVALHGITRVTDPRHTDFFIVADDDCVAVARDTTRAFIEAGISLAIVPASEVVGAAERLFAAYGLFTSGHRLASAAYYRIYFARFLQKRGLHGRALYVDSDIVFTTPLDRLLHADLAGHPVAARLETPRPEVRRAIAHHKLADGRYFNSGVLLMDLQHPGLAAALDTAVQAIADQGVTLLYHDQCALNLGFREQFADLDMAWNYPVTETTTLADIPAETGILHFLDRPKPWSAAYGGEAGPLWFDKWREAADFIGDAAAMTLFAEIQD